MPTVISKPRCREVRPGKGSSSDEGVASVAGGIVTANNYGTAVIKVSTTDGLVSASSQVIVEPDEVRQGYGALRMKWLAKLLGGDQLNYGSAGYLNIKNGPDDYLRRTLLNYDLAGITDEIESVQLHVYGKNERLAGNGRQCQRIQRGGQQLE
ncbi:hypothetical protein [Paenibacillus sp. S150]|uniref:CBM96 family carbohydrate-binding protein n=1 Tax=Paenibacillus sp. S150 TaxID=2749826 RepID=UPI001C56F72B|nr:hypothetical protein [Paenibacillus sp. S150]MBW4084165.1 hypothetical protein [Paenibacillus sp. S150]